jgi:hypothetical protein
MLTLPAVAEPDPEPTLILTRMAKLVFNTMGGETACRHILEICHRVSISAASCDRQGPGPEQGSVISVNLTHVR